ncbi:nucleotidyltransferase family protein [Bacillus cereus group sp. N21]|uniref:nucleotidyltransferase family protein n=1 Tax=Bacillus cereus group sp. N21 TaxID=2794591 RepID=UPI0018F3A4C7|nr:nucleotidyltransferase family protein [Bacillus cereus group sp. N21]MBJ8030419.1 nucleotidyltransferase family protein [Bacillus cereus group sp. N21]
MHNTLSQEEQLVLLLSKLSLNKTEIENLKKLLYAVLDWNLVLGMLQVHRTSGIAWKNIRDHAIHERKNFKATYFLKSLEIMYKGQYQTALENIELNYQMLKEFENRGVEYTLVKGSIIAQWAYEDFGLRMFNDNDLLISLDKLPEVGKILNELGYVQGSWNYDTNSINLAKRNEVLYLKMNSHQTYPYMMATPDCVFLDCHKVDVQFSVDLMSRNRTEDIVKEMLNRRVKVLVNGKFPMWALQEEDMLFFVCMHFYKEAIYRSEVQIMKDLVLYKMVDIYGLFVNKRFCFNIDTFIGRIKKYGFEKEIYFALHYVNEVFPDIIPQKLLEALRPESIDYLSEVLDSSNAVHKWEDPIVKRFFNMDRVAELNK